MRMAHDLMLRAEARDGALRGPTTILTVVAAAVGAAKPVAVKAVALSAVALMAEGLFSAAAAVRRKAQAQRKTARSQMGCDEHPGSSLVKNPQNGGPGETSGFNVIRSLGASWERDAPLRHEVNAPSRPEVIEFKPMACAGQPSPTGSGLKSAGALQPPPPRHSPASSGGRRWAQEPRPRTWW